MLEAVRVFVRYETPNKDDETRRARNEVAGEHTPEFIIPEMGQHLWDIHRSIIRNVSRFSDGAYRLISPCEFEAWFRLTRTLVYPKEYDILAAMDGVYCEEANKELEDIRSKQQEQQIRDIEKSKSKPRGR